MKKEVKEKKRKKGNLYEIRSLKAFLQIKHLQLANNMRQEKENHEKIEFFRFLNDTVFMFCFSIKKNLGYGEKEKHRA